jgi:hypothetical protein
MMKCPLWQYFLFHHVVRIECYDWMFIAPLSGIRGLEHNLGGLCAGDSKSLIKNKKGCRLD